MYTRIKDTLQKLSLSDQSHVLCGGLKGLEKESLRVNKQGGISQTPHPIGLGSALTNPYITTDYSEALLEFITPPFKSSTDTLAFMESVHTFTYQHLENEMLWATSMPCIVDGDLSIPIANYGSSHSGKMKHVYRIGLWHRYGRSMQAIAGIHFNYSLAEEFWPTYQKINNNTQDKQEFISECYMDMTRNLHRYGWLILYLFGASPAICRSFLKGQDHASFDAFDSGTLYKKYATSLRMSDIGYKNDSQSGINISYNSLNEYVSRLIAATEKPFRAYEEIGLKDSSGQYLQLNCNILQIENEYYSNVRPKQIIQAGERPSEALQKRGVRYVELRSVDLNPFAPSGIDQEQLYFLEAFMVFCLLADSPLLSKGAKLIADKNQAIVASEGRKPNLELQKINESTSLHAWGLEICDEMIQLCQVLDANAKEEPYSAALALQVQKLNDVRLTPSAMVLKSMHDNDLPFFKFAMSQSQQHHDFFNQKVLTKAHSNLLKEAQQQSISDQQQIERADSGTFEKYLEQYFSKHAGSPVDLPL